MLLICTDGVAWQLTESQRFVAIYALIIICYWYILVLYIYMILYANTIWFDMRSESNVRNSVCWVWCFPKGFSTGFLQSLPECLESYPFQVWEFILSQEVRLEFTSFHPKASMLSVDGSCHGKNLLVNKVSSGTTTFFELAHFSRLSTWRRSSQIASRRIPRKFWLEHLKVLNLRLFVHGHSSLIGCGPGLLSLETGPTNGPTESVI